MASPLYSVIEQVLGKAPLSMTPLSGGCVAEVYKVCLPGGTNVVAKVDSSESARLALEGHMLRYLHQHSQLPVPAVLHCSDALLIMEFIEGESHFSSAAQQHAAELLAGLHDSSASHFGFDTDTLIGGLHQPNPKTARWLDFFRDHRVLYMAGEAHRAGRMPAQMMQRLEKFAARLSNWLEEPEHPSLIHGDVWTTNVLAQKGRITGFIDPAIYFAHAEIELAFTTLFGTFGGTFLERYHEIRPLAGGLNEFMEIRKDIYNVYPLLVHVRLFGGSYLHSVDRVLQHLGC